MAGPGEFTSIGDDYSDDSGDTYADDSQNAHADDQDIEYDDPYYADSSDDDGYPDEPVDVQDGGYDDGSGGYGPNAQAAPDVQTGTVNPATGATNTPRARPPSMMRAPSAAVPRRLPAPLPRRAPAPHVDVHTLPSLVGVRKIGMPRMRRI